MIFYLIQQFYNLLCAELVIVRQCIEQAAVFRWISEYGYFVRMFSSTHKGDRYDVIEILLKMALSSNIIHKHYLPFIICMYIAQNSKIITRLTRRVPLLYQELLTLREHLSSPPLCSGVPVTLSLILYVCFVDRCLSFCAFSFGHCLVCPSIYGLPFWYLQTLLIVDIRIVRVVKLLITQILLFCLRYFVLFWRH